MKQLKTILAVAFVAILVPAAPAIAQVKDYRDIKFHELPDFKIPRPEVFVMSNGMTVFLMEDHELPLVSVTARIRTGSNYDPADKVGLASIFGQVQREGGTASMTGNEIDDFLEARAASIETGMGGDVGFASMNCLVEDFGDVFDLFRDVLREPVFDDEKIDVAKVQTSAGIARRNDSIAGITGREFSRLMYGQDTALGRNVEYATIAAISRDDLLAWHKKYYHPNNTYLGVVGDFDTAEMKAKVETTFGDWPKGAAFDEPEPSFKMVEPGMYFVEKEDVTQAYVRLGHMGIKKSDPDFFAVQMMNEVFGGGFASRLFSHIRSQKSLAYSVFGGIGDDFVRPGVFQVGLSTKSETMGASVDALEEEINDIIQNPPSKEELTKARESILNSFVFNYTSRGQILGQQMLYTYYGIPDDFLTTYRQKIEAVTGDDVARVAKEYIHPDRLVMLVVGNPSDFDRSVDTFGTVTKLDISIAPPADSRAKVQRSAANVAAGAEMFATASRKLGGEGKDVETVSASFDLTLKLGGQAMQLSQDVSYAFPDKLYTALKTPMGDQVMILNGGEGFVVAGGQTQALPEDRVMDGLKQVTRDLLVLATHTSSPGFEAIAGEMDEVNGVKCTIVSVSFSGAESQLCIGEDGTVLRQAYQGKHPMQGTPGLIEVLFEDYAEVDGMMVPYKRVMFFEGDELATMALKSLEINPELDSAMFEKPN